MLYHLNPLDHKLRKKAMLKSLVKVLEAKCDLGELHYPATALIFSVDNFCDFLFAFLFTKSILKSGLF